MFNERDASVVSLMGDDYVEHNPLFGDGSGDVLGLIAELPDVGGDAIETHRVVEEAGFVAIHSSYALNEAFEPDEGAGSVAVDIFRFDTEGQVVEHWSVIQDAVPPEATVSGRSMVDGGGDPAANSDVAANVAVVRRLFEEGFANADVALLDELFAPEYIDHDPAATNGVERLRSFLEAGPIPVEVARVIPQGDLVFVHSHYTDGPLGDASVANIFRLENGAIVEHWSVAQATVPASETVSGNDMFSQLS